MNASAMGEGLVNGRWPLRLTPDRVEFHGARPTWEAGRLADCAERMEPGMVVYDVGAECGDFTALYRSWVGPAGDVVPVEPQPAYWPAIRAHWEANGGDAPGHWFCGFAGAETVLEPFAGRLERQGWPQRDWPVCSEGRIQPDYGFRHLAQQADSTPQIRLDDLAERTVAPDAVVMDIEGAEWHALSGASGLLAGGRPTFWVSVHEETMLAWYLRTLDDIHTLMAGFDYVGIELVHHGEAETFWRFDPR